MSERSICGECGAAVPTGTPGGACPACLLSGGLEHDPEDGLPSREELAAAFPDVEFLELLGRGGMGAVYRARQTRLDRVVALKVLIPRDDASRAAFAERFAREARALARLEHRNIVRVYEFGERDRLYFLVMEHVDGVNLREAMQLGEITPHQSLAIVPQICDALQYAHDKGVVHRDIKPENVLLAKNGTVKVADFGLAKLIAGPAEDLTLTRAGQVMGTLHYMAPEQIESPSAVDHRADIYSLGVVFYELLTGDLPLGRFDPPSERVQVDARLDDVVLRALARKRERRWQKVSEVKTAVSAITDPGSGAPHAGATAARPVAGSASRPAAAAAPAAATGKRPVSRAALASLLLVPGSVLVPALIAVLASAAGVGGVAWAALFGLALALTLVGVVLGIVGLARTGRDGPYSGRWMAVVGTFGPLLWAPVILVSTMWLGASRYNEARRADRIREMEGTPVWTDVAEETSDGGQSLPTSQRAPFRLGDFTLHRHPSTPSDWWDPAWLHAQLGYVLASAGDLTLNESASEEQWNELFVADSGSPSVSRRTLVRPPAGADLRAAVSGLRLTSAYVDVSSGVATAVNEEWEVRFQFRVDRKPKAVRLLARPFAWTPRTPR